MLSDIAVAKPPMTSTMQCVLPIVGVHTKDQHIQVSASLSLRCSLACDVPCFTTAWQVQ